MTVETLVHRAIDRVDGEREQVAAHRESVERFAKEVADLDPVEVDTPTQPRLTDGGMVTTIDRSDSTADRCRQVRESFAETIRPHSVTDADDEPLLETIGEELGRDIAVALAPGTDGAFTPQVKRAVTSATADRRAELEAFDLALEREADSLEAARSDIDVITAWLCRANETPLLELDFEALRERHETLERHRERCRDLLRERQSVLQETATYNGSAGVRQRTVAGFLYREFSTAHPVLTTALRLEEVCADCQRTVRDHLTRRV
ncbi:DUF7260 family protein [Halopiger goleimassiliensis]|uniref:DUF7260 family protein n=1 Tax=Halopiger goleimassiliensis TaxID=1293048 RepID=UPI000677DA71|nr:hypothetical protein [Halopiger goleimassiliensis]